MRMKEVISRFGNKANFGLASKTAFPELATASSKHDKDLAEWANGIVNQDEDEEIVDGMLEMDLNKLCENIVRGI